VAIKNKDGSLYKLTSPNPIRRNQNEWNDDSPIILHNFSWENTKVENNSSVLKPFDSDLSNMVSVVDMPLPKIEIEVEETPVEEETIEVEEKVIEEPIEEVIEEKSKPIVKKQVKKYDSETEKFLNDKKITMWCSPPVITEHKDDLYGDIQRTIEYNRKFSFEGVILEQTDLEMKFWTPVKLTRNSIVFPVDKKTRKARWWKIVEVQEKDGILARCILSDQSLNFGD